MMTVYVLKFKPCLSHNAISNSSLLRLSDYLATNAVFKYLRVRLTLLFT